MTHYVYYDGDELKIACDQTWKNLLFHDGARALDQITWDKSEVTCSECYIQMDDYPGEDECPMCGSHIHENGYCFACQDFV